MRAPLPLGLILAALIAAAPLQAQPKKKKEAPPTALTTRAVVARLQLEIDTAPLRERMKFKEFLKIISADLEAHNREVTFDVNVEAFVERYGADAPNPYEEEILIISHRKRAPAIDLLNQAVRQIGRASGDSGRLVIRGGRVEIMPASYTVKEFLLNESVRADFKEQRLDLALEELSDLTGVSIVIDARAKRKAQTTVTARFNGDVAVQDAVRMLTDMAELKIVYLVTGIYVTTPEHAKGMQKELKDLYEPKGAPAPVGMPGFGGPPPDPFFDPPISPLAPPLPPMRGGKRLEPAA